MDPVTESSAQHYPGGKRMIRQGDQRWNRAGAACQVLYETDSEKTKARRTDGLLGLHVAMSLSRSPVRAVARASRPPTCLACWKLGVTTTPEGRRTKARGLQEKHRAAGAACISDTRSCSTPFVTRRGGHKGERDSHELKFRHYTRSRASDFLRVDLNCACCVATPTMSNS